MSREEFEIKFKEILGKYSAYWEWNCDAWQLADGIIFYKNEEDKKGFVHIQGIGYDSNGELIGNFDSFLGLLMQSLEKEYGY